MCIRDRSTVHSPSGLSPRRAVRTACRSGVTTIGSSAFFRALPLKMSAKLVETMARTPHARSAQGACSREDPAPKLSPTRRIWRPALCGSSMNDIGSRRFPSGVKRQSKNSASARPALSVILRKRAGQIWSVSMLARGIEITRLVVLANRSGMSEHLHGRGPPYGHALHRDAVERARVGDNAGHGTGGGGERRCEERSPAPALPSLEAVSYT